LIIKLVGADLVSALFSYQFSAHYSFYSSWADTRSAPTYYTLLFSSRGMDL